MPSAAIISAATRITALARAGVKNSLTAGFAMSRKIAAAGRMLISAANRAARASYRAFVHRAKSLASRARLLGEQLRDRLVRMLRILRLAALRVVRAVKRIFISPSQPSEPSEDEIKRLSQRFPGAASAIDALADALRDEALMRRLVELLPDLEEEDPDELSLDALMKAYQAEVQSLLDEFQDQEDDIALEAFYERAVPYILAARLAAGDDPTVLDDVDIEEHLAQVSEDFIEVLRNDSPAKTLSESATALFNAVSSSYRRSRTRLAMAHNLVVSVNSEQFIPFASVQDVARMNAEQVADLAEAYGRVKRGQFDISNIINRIKEFIRSFARQIAEIMGFSQEEEGMPEERQIDTDVEEQIIYGVWRTNCTRQVSRHCPDCLALEALTALQPVPFENLPTPGVETACGSYCACCVDEVSLDEVIEFSTIYWQGAPYFLYKENIEQMMREEGGIDRELVFSMMPVSLVGTLRKWLDLIEKTTDVPHT